MDADFWLQRWQEGQIGFHRSDVMPLLEKHWPSLQVRADARVLVPLCGKSLDMHWLAAQGYRVLGVELSPLAVAQFFQEAGVEPVRTVSQYGDHFTAGPIEIILGDAFGLEPALLADVEAVYDRAALIALPPALRRRYLDTLYASLPSGCRGLLITLEYPQQQKDGPPFSVGQAEVEALFASPWQHVLLERRDILDQEPRFQAEGLTALTTAVYRLRRT
ncbi:thiopurine S-methyltransferase [Pseudoxanthomonas sp. PXM03]|uniref:thiopurine S-methyltransferase n=1 Tax=Pseudoxanthomonas sp. PXM03 TaxID=2769284 RepID=UPI001785ABE0|nr:thiopurine S-methyltransferase [Pseudoxanthomonas sp. PXM03]MBD9435508.1 thiopurine S-methyltransferase [Pseudoxanthomonas sp. PXM03]